MNRFLVAAVVLCSVFLLALQLFVSLQPIQVQATSHLPPCDGTWSTSGQHSCVVPAGVTELVADVRGAAGDDGYGQQVGKGGKGGRVQTLLQVTPGQTLDLYVGGKGFVDTSGQPRTTGGFNGGGNGSPFTCNTTPGLLSKGGGGGGASDIRRGGTKLIVAGGGGGGGGINSAEPMAGTGGAGGGGNPDGNGENGGSAEAPGGQGGRGATTSGGGAGGGGGGGAFPGNSGTAGSSGQGGTGGSGGTATVCGGGGGGGGGYFGGGGGGGGGGVNASWPPNPLGGAGGGGGGGSSYCSGACNNPQFRPAFQSNDGYIELRPFTAGTPSVIITNPGAGSWQNSSFQVQYTATGGICTLEVRDGSSAPFGSPVIISCGGTSTIVQVPGACSVEGQNECGARITAASVPPIPIQVAYKATPGSTSWTVPTGVSEIEVELWGAQGGSGQYFKGFRGGGNTGFGGAGGLGGYVKTKLQNLTAGDVISIAVGGAGISFSGEGGEASIIRVNGTPAVVAAAGGGGGEGVAITDFCDEGDSTVFANGGSGGAGGSLVGTTGGNGSIRPPTGSVSPSQGGQGGNTTTSTGGTGGGTGAFAGQNGSLGSGGTGGSAGAVLQARGQGGGGEGGDGRYGGGGGEGGDHRCQGSSDHVSAGAGGGGGSSYVNSTYEVAGSTTHTQGCADCRGPGAVAISYIPTALPGSSVQDQRDFSIDYTDPVAQFDVPPTLPAGTQLTANFPIQYDATDARIATCELSSSNNGGSSWTPRSSACGTDQIDTGLFPGWCSTGVQCAIRIWAEDIAGNTAESIINYQGAVFGGLVPCGRQLDAVNTPWDETQNCTLSHLFLLLWIIVDFLLWKLAPLLIVIMVVATGVIMYFQLGGTGTILLVKRIWRYIGIGVAVLLLSWLALNFFLGIFGFDINIFGRWYSLQID